MSDAPEPLVTTEKPERKGDPVAPKPDTKPPAKPGKPAEPPKPKGR